MDHEQQRIRLEKKANAIFGFYTNLGFYVVINACLIGLNLWTNPENFWAIWPVLGWGIAVVAHGLSVWGAGYRERFVKRAVDKAS